MQGGAAKIRKQAVWQFLLASVVSLYAGQGALAEPAGSPNQQAVGMYNLGLSAYKQGSLDSAIIFFRRATDLDPNLADAQYNLGVLYQSERRVKEAIPRFQEVLRVKPSDPDAHYQLGLALLEMGRPAEAKTHLQAIAPSSAHFADAQKKIGVCDQQMSGATVATPSYSPQAASQGTGQSQTALNMNLSPMAGDAQDTTYQGNRQAYQTPAQPYQPSTGYQAPSQPYQPAQTYQTTQAYQPSTAYQPQTQSQPQAQVQVQPQAQGSHGYQTQIPSLAYQPQTPAMSGSTVPANQAARPVSKSGAPTAVLANSSVRVIATGFSAPSGLTFDRQGNLYVANFDSNIVERISSDGSRMQFSSGANLKGPIGLAADDAGNVYVANYSGNTVVRISPSGVSTVIGTGFKRPYYLTVDKEGNLFVSQQEDNSIVRITLPRSASKTQ